ncbi:MAG: hypothetical protein ABII88_06125 [Candidatus Omnitrophota bacterium]
MQKTSSLSRIEERMSEAEPGSLRYSVLECAKNFKSSWIELGQHLMSIHRDKEYKAWGYQTFDTYCVKEIGIRKETALKLLRSYRFLEEEEPEYIKKEYLEAVDTQKIPSYENINILKKAKDSKELGIADYRKMKEKVFDEGRGEKEVKDAYSAMLKAVRETDPEEARQERRIKYIRRMIGSLNLIKKEIRMNKLLPEKVVADIDKIISTIELELA